MAVGTAELVLGIGGYYLMLLFLSWMAMRVEENVPERSEGEIGLVYVGRVVAVTHFNAVRVVGMLAVGFAEGVKWLFTPKEGGE